MRTEKGPEPELMCDVQILSGILRLGVKMFGYGADYEMTTAFSSDGHWATCQGLAERLNTDKNRATRIIRAAKRTLATLGLGMRFERKRKDGTNKWVILPLKGQDYKEGVPFTPS